MRQTFLAKEIGHGTPAWGCWSGAEDACEVSHGPCSPADLGSPVSVKDSLCRGREHMWAVQFSSVAQSCPFLWDSMDCSTPGLPVHCQLLEFTQTHVHRVGNGDLGSIPGLGRSPGGGDSNPRQYSSLENPHRQRSLVGSSPWGRKEDMTKQLSTAQRKHCTL